MESEIRSNQPIGIFPLLSRKRICLYAIERSVSAGNQGVVPQRVCLCPYWGAKGFLFPHFCGDIYFKFERNRYHGGKSPTKSI